MPTISFFYGIIIVMNQTSKEHNPPHVHAFYGNESASFKISDGEILNGKFPNKGAKMVKEFILHYQKELLEMWNTSNYHSLKPLL